MAASHGLEALGSSIEPLLEPASALSLRQKQNAKAQLDKGYGIDGDLALVDP